MTRYIFPLLFYVLAALCLNVSAGELAWNGHTTPGSTAFRPYYVPSGSKSYDSASPLVRYSGRWTEIHSPAYTGGSLRQTLQVQASVSFTFFGTGIEWFGNRDMYQGISDVYIDRDPVRKVDVWYDGKRLTQQRLFWRYDLRCQKHTLKIVNTGARPGSTHDYATNVDAFVVTGCRNSQRKDDVHAHSSLPPLLLSTEVESANKWTLEQKGSTGVHAMQLTIISSTHALVVDKVEHNPLTIDGHPAWAALYDIENHGVMPLAMVSNSFCAGGTFLGNGTLINVGGNPVVEDNTSSADFGDVDGLQAVRLLDPCLSSSASGCKIYESPDRIRMASPRWYNTVLRISDGSAMIIGGSKKGGWMNNETVNNPTIEFFPPKSIHGSNGLPIDLPFLHDTLNSNLFPVGFLLPDGTVFIAANNDAMIYNWKTNTERRLPAIPNGVRVTYPMAGTALLLPLSPHNKYQPEILLCGGSTIDDTRPSYNISSKEPASAQCARMVLTDPGIAAGWEVEQMPEARLMPDAVLLPTGDILICNGAGTGISGYGNVVDQVGASNAADPVLTPVLYNPSAPLGARFSRTGMPTSDIPRMYHSVATLTPNGDIMIAGSNPNLDRSEVEYGTEYRVEWLRPPYMTKPRPQMMDVPEQLQFGETVEITIQLPTGFQDRSDIKVALMDYGYVTHAVHANSRLVYLVSRLSAAGTKITITAPPNSMVYPPGPGWLVVVVDEVPSKAQRVMVGDGKGPEVDEKALKNVLENTKPDQYEASKSKGGEE
ncbi:copper radical oxidase [Mycena metata]|uniref:Copper radical oxidase n=1 Tax=Mycena metata TaxID=1033252 RepID=A0AAD7K210_9AGAR|nr:copper radical oxidase [Mycena metata]